MNRTSILNFAASLFIATLPFATYTPAAQAQNKTLAVVSIPFAFELGSSHLKPGTYAVSMQGDNFIVIRGASSSAINLMRRNDDTQSEEATKVVFHRYGDQYFLREVWGANESSHLVNAETKDEAKARKAQLVKTASHHGAEATIEVAIAANRD